MFAFDRKNTKLHIPHCRLDALRFTLQLYEQPHLFEHQAYYYFMLKANNNIICGATTKLAEQETTDTRSNLELRLLLSYTLREAFY